MLYTCKRKCMKELYTWRVKRMALSYGVGLRVNNKSVVTSNTKLGDYVNFNGMSIYGEGKVLIGDYFHSGQNCRIITSFHNYEGDRIPYDDTYIHKDVHIGSCVWLGNDVLILGGVTIGEGAIIQAGSVVCKDIPPYAIAGGHPAAVFKYRDIEHYEMLKEMKMYF